MLVVCALDSAELNPEHRSLASRGDDLSKFSLVSVQAPDIHYLTVDSTLSGGLYIDSDFRLSPWGVTRGRA